VAWNDGRMPSLPAPSLRVIRWGGLGASAAVALTGYLAGDPDHRNAAWVGGGLLWLLAAGTLTWLWLRLRHHDDTTTVRWLVLTGALWAVPFLLAPPLGSHDIWAYACQGQAWQHGFDVYRTGPAEAHCTATWLQHVPPLWRHTPTPYGPLWILLEGLAAAAAGTSLAAVATLLRLTAIVLGVGVMLRAGLPLAASAPSFVRLAVISPLVLVHVVSGAHNDALVAGFTLLGLYFCATPRHPARAVALSGLAFGAAAAVKITALVAVPFAVPLLLAGRVRPARVLAVGPALLAAAAVGYAAFALVTHQGLGFVHAFASTGDLVQWLSLPTGVGMAVGYLLRLAGLGAAGFSGAVAVARVIGYVVLAVSLFVLWGRAVRRSRDTEAVLTCAGLALLAVAVLGPVFYAWYALGGLTVLATTALGGRWRTAVTAAAGGLIFLTLPDSLGLATKTKVPGALLDVALVVWALVWAARHRQTVRRAW
jgi:alpha-1,6-mannosyltransferase